MMRLATAILFMSQTVFAAPVITSVSGSVAEGNSITISGIGFGNGPNVVLFDNFESGSNGVEIADNAAATTGSWGVHADCRPSYSTANARSGTKSLRADMNLSGCDSEPWNVYAKANLDSNTKEVYVSYWMLYPSGTNVPFNHKIIWLMKYRTHSCSPHSDCSDLYAPAFPNNTNSNAVVNGNGLALGGYSSQFFTTDIHSTKGTWRRHGTYVKFASGSGQDKFEHYDTKDGVWGRRKNETSLTWGANDGTWFWTQLRLNGYGTQTSNSYPTYDDVYIASGANARARVEASNCNTYTGAGCTNSTVFVPTAWSDTSITATCRLGSISGGDVYLNIIDSNGSVSNAYLLPLGPEQPPPPIPLEGTPGTRGSLTIKGSMTIK